MKHSTRGYGVNISLDEWEKRKSQELRDHSQKKFEEANYQRSKAKYYLDHEMVKSEEEAEEFIKDRDTEMVKEEVFQKSDKPEYIARSGRYKLRKRIIHRDNKDALNLGNGQGYGDSVRVPSLKRSKRVWRNFYRLFPRFYESMKQGNPKLKKI